MEGKMNHYMLKLRLHKLQDLRELCKQLMVKQNGKRDEVANRLVSFLLTPEGKREAKAKLPPEFYEKFYEEKENNQPEYPIDCLCDNSVAGGIVKCKRCHKNQHTMCMSKQAQAQNYECVPCQMQQMHPLDEVIEFLVLPFPIRLDSYTPTERSFDNSTELQGRIYSSRGEIQIQIRCIKLDGIGYTHTWPKHGYLTVNGKNVMEFNVSKNPNAKQRKDEILNITVLLVPGRNTIGINKFNDLEIYSCAVMLIRNKTEDMLIKDISERPGIGIVEAKEMVAKKLESTDEEIVSESVKLSLKCPFSMTLMEIPVRGTNCTHIQCFNLATFIRLQRSSRVNRWRCPVCRGFAFDMVVDRYFESIIKEASLDCSDLHSVEFSRDGSYKIITFDEYIAEQEQDELAKKALEQAESESIKIEELQQTSEGPETGPKMHRNISSLESCISVARKRTRQETDVVEEVKSAKISIASNQRFKNVETIELD